MPGLLSQPWQVCSPKEEVRKLTMKRFLLCVLMIVMTFTMTPLAAFAEDPAGPENSLPPVSVENSSGESLGTLQKMNVTGENTHTRYGGTVPIFYKLIVPAGTSGNLTFHSNDGEEYYFASSDYGKSKNTVKNTGSKNKEDIGPKENGDASSVQYTYSVRYEETEASKPGFGNSKFYIQLKNEDGGHISLEEAGLDTRRYIAYLEFGKKNDYRNKKAVFGLFVQFGEDQNITDTDLPKPLRVQDVWFRYSRESGDVLRGLSFDVRAGEFFCLLGGNGVGKSTTLKILSGMAQPQSGSVTIDGIKVKKEGLKQLFEGRLAMLPQNPQALFTEITVEEELLEALYYEDGTDAEKVDAIERMLQLMEIEHLRKAHPYDLSGGEQQRLALGKILLLKPKILLLDEPTKGLDPFFKLTLAGIFKKLKETGVTIFMVSHDIEFCAEHADRCAMFFDGDIASIGTPREFFAGNSFYTTAANRVARQWAPEAITWEEVAHWAEQAITNKA